MTTLSACLASLGLTAADFSTTGADPDAGFGVVKRAYFKLALSSHPDKGGDPSVFRAVQEAWESVREAHESGQIAGAWAAYCEGGGAASAPARGARVGVVPSYSWFTAAAAEAVPPYIVEHARSSRSSCTQKSATFCAHLDPLIEKGEVRCGSLDPESGGYGRFMHLRCWRVPATVWLGLPTAGADTTVVETALAAMESVTLIGFPTLDVTGKAAFVAHVTDSTNWARLSGKAKAANDAADAAASGEISGAASASTLPKKVKGKSKDSKAAAVEQAVVDVVMSSPKSGAALVPVLARATTGIGSFLLPRPGVNGAVAGALSGKTFVLTGVFPEVGGGLGLDLGKARVRECVESFGGRVTGSVSGATTHLIVGQAPGASKVRSARSKGVAMLDVQGLKTVLEKPGATLADAPAPTITSYSAGYFGNGLAMLNNFVDPMKLAAISEAASAKKHIKKAKKTKASKMQPESATSAAVVKSALSSPVTSSIRKRKGSASSAPALPTNSKKRR